ncbi:MAG: hypothetical protein AAGF12_29205 [Myxococcota bacterium]
MTNSQVDKAMSRAAPGMRRGHQTAACLLAVLALGLTPSAMQAQDARTLFEEGVAALEAGDAARGRDLLRRSLELDSRATTRFNYAIALQRTGALVAAGEHLRALLAEDRLAQRVQQAAELQLEELDSLIPCVEIDLRGPRRATFFVDGERRRPRENHTLCVDPGFRQLEVRASGFRPVALELSLERETKRTVVVSMHPVDATAPAEDGGSGWIWAAAIGGTALVAAAVTVALVIALSPEPVEDDVFGVVEALRFAQ